LKEKHIIFISHYHTHTNLSFYLAKKMPGNCSRSKLFLAAVIHQCDLSPLIPTIPNHNKNSHMILEHTSFVMHAEIWNGPINFVSFRRELWPNNWSQLLLHRHMHVCATNDPFKANLLDCRPCCCRHLSHLYFCPPKACLFTVHSYSRD